MSETKEFKCGCVFLSEDPIRICNDHEYDLEERLDPIRDDYISDLLEDLLAKEEITEEPE